MTKLSITGPSCHDGQSHFDNPNFINEDQRIVMNELNNHADWDAFVDSSPDDFHEARVVRSVDRFSSTHSLFFSSLLGCSSFVHLAGNQVQ